MIGKTFTEEMWDNPQETKLRLEEEANRRAKAINDSFEEGHWDEIEAKIRYAKQVERIDSTNTNRYNPDGTLKMNIDSFPDIPKWNITTKQYSWGGTYEIIERETENES